MGKWNYTINGGIKLRELIDEANGSNRDAKKVLFQLKECINELIGKLDKNDEIMYGTDLEELKDESNELRICISTNKDYYVASSYYFTHNDILEMLDIDPYIDCIIWIDSNIMSIYQYEDNTSKFKFTYNKMIKNGLINRNTKLIDYINSNCFF
jgi:hypothetical protein